jgi:hypothetical protein
LGCNVPDDKGDSSSNSKACGAVPGAFNVNSLHRAVPKIHFIGTEDPPSYRLWAEIYAI